MPVDIHWHAFLLHNSSKVPANNFFFPSYPYSKQRYVNTGEHVLRKNKLKKKVSTLQERGKALEIKFAKQCYKIYTGGKSNDYKKVSINYQSWLYPLEGEDAKYFIPLPNRECTYEKLGDAKELLEYLEKCIE